MTGGFRKDHLPELDGLRAIAVLLVLWQHVPELSVPRLVYRVASNFLEPEQATAWGRRAIELKNFWFAAGYSGVDLFFVLSGFLITRILLVDKGRGHPLKYFLLRRFLRIFPIYYLTLLVVWIVRGGPELPWCAAYLSNYWLGWNPVVTPLDHTWSLAVEEHFYLFWPLVVYALSFAGSRRFALFVLLPMALASAIANGLIWNDASVWSHGLKWSQYGTTYRVGSLGLGALLAYAEPRLRRSTRLCLGAAAAAFVVGYGTYVLGVVRATSHGVEELVVPARLVGMSLTCTAFVLFCIGTTGGRNPASRLLRSGPLRYVGRISYGVYLYHMPVFFWIWIERGRHRDPSELPSTAETLGVVALVFALASLSYFVLERPILRYAARFRTPAPADT